MNEIQEKLEYYSKNIAEEICDKPSFNVKEIQLTIKTRIFMALKELLNEKITILEKKRVDLKDEYLNQDVPNWRKEDIKRVLANLNSEIKVFNKTSSDAKDLSEYVLLKNYVRENFGDKSMVDFYKIINK